MLDDLSSQILARPLIAILGYEFFMWSPNATEVVNWPAIQSLQCRSGIWRIIYAAHDEKELKWYQRVSDLAVFFLDVLTDATHDLEQLKAIIWNADLVFAPKFCQTRQLRVHFQPPATVAATVQLLEYFSINPVSFTPAAYYEALRSI